MIIEQAYRLQQSLEGTILHAFPALNHTFVLVVRHPSDRVSAMHVDWKGKVITKLYIEEIGGSQSQLAKMVNSHKLAYVDKKCEQVQYVDFQTKKAGWLYNMFPEKRILGMEFFRTTNLILIVAQDQNVQTNNHFHLIYIDPQNWKFIEKFNQLITDSVSYTFHQGNSHSMMIWGHRLPKNGRTGKCFEVFTKSLKEKMTKFTIGLPPVYEYVQLQKIWETKKGRFMFVCRISFKDSSQAIKGLFTYDVQSAVLSQVHSSNWPTVWELMKLDELSILLNFQQTQSKRMAVSVLHNRSLDVIAEFQWKNTGQQRLFAADHQSGSFLHLDQSEGKAILKMYRFCFARKDQYLHLMLGLNKDLDDDLLQEALTLLEEI